MKAQLAGHFDRMAEAIGRKPEAAIVFHFRLQLFVPFAQKDARLEGATLAGFADRGAADRSESGEMKVKP
jgi:hypothetical protein